MDIQVANGMCSAFGVSLTGPSSDREPCMGLGTEQVDIHLSVLQLLHETDSKPPCLSPAQP